MAVTVETHGALADAARAMAGGGTYMGGGTVLMRGVNDGSVQGRLLRSTDPALRAIRATGDGFTLGAGVTMADVLASRDLEFLHPVARVIGGPQVRAMATVGGNLFAPHPYGDFATALLALGARVVPAAGGSPRPLDDILRDRARPHLLAAIEVPRPRDARAFGFLKVSRVKPKGVSVLSIAAHLPRDGGRLRNVRVSYGAMGPAPLRAVSVEQVLEGQSLDPATIARAAQVAAEGLDPPTDPISSGWYRREVVGVHLKRLLERMA
ncbi:FAD binding domain-containing protein [Szabonella alba]|uniref:FAD binding domain-containing protein n=1 Tax=Szabonella alba TaxID=2804194 RepID=A0A8K0Y0R2_9RHOB|nr:FAD binding domain-containing protein [Szabonella alba]MBL4918091.1 FAD binding domain-containing protein [Szabonella alba]